MSALTPAPIADSSICFPGTSEATCEDFSLAALRRTIEEEYASCITNLSDEKLDNLAAFAASIHANRPRLTPLGCCELAYELDREGGC